MSGVGWRQGTRVQPWLATAATPPSAKWKLYQSLSAALSSLIAYPSPRRYGSLSGPSRLSVAAHPGMAVAPGTRPPVTFGDSKAGVERWDLPPEDHPSPTRILPREYPVPSGRRIWPSAATWRDRPSPGVHRVDEDCASCAKLGDAGVPTPRPLRPIATKWRHARPLLGIVAKLADQQGPGWQVFA